MRALTPSVKHWTSSQLLKQTDYSNFTLFLFFFLKMLFFDQKIKLKKTKTLMGILQMIILKERKIGYQASFPHTDAFPDACKTCAVAYCKMSYATVSGNEFTFNCFCHTCMY